MATLKKIKLDYAPLTQDYFGLRIYLFQRGEMVGSRGSGVYPNAFYLLPGNQPPGVEWRPGSLIFTPHEGGDILWEGEVEADEAIIEAEDVSQPSYVVHLITKGKDTPVPLQTMSPGAVQTHTVKLTDGFPWGLVGILGGAIAVMALARRK